MYKRLLILLFFPILISLVGLACGGSDSETSFDTSTRSTPPAVVSTKFAQDENIYAANMSEIASLYTEGFQKISDLSISAGARPTLMTDEAWRSEMVLALAQIKVANNSVREMDPPSRFEDIHSNMVKAAGYYDDAVDLFARGLDEFSLPLMEQAATKMDLGNQALNQAAVQTQRVLAAPSAQDATGDSKATANQGANLRAGPGTDFARVGGVTEGDTLELIATNEAGDWYQLANGAWIAAFLVDGAPTGLPVSSKVLETP